MIPLSRSLVYSLLGALGVVSIAWAQVANGFDLSDSLIPVREIRGGGPPRDGIPALTDPPRVSAKAAAGWLQPDDRVIGIAIGGEAVAYPIRIMNWHEIVNDVIGGQPVVVSYCPLCGTGVVFDGRIDGRRVAFGVSGLLYNSDVLLYDRRTLSLFSQMLFKAVSGPLRGTELQTLPAVTTTWEAWRRQQPGTQVLSHNLGYGRDYSSDPYHWYRRSGTTMFPVKGADTSRNSKSWAYLILSGEEKLLVAEETLKDATGRGEQGRFLLEDAVELSYDPEGRELRVHDERGELTVIPGYWFALTAFHPQSRQLTVDSLKPVSEEYSAG